MSKDITKAHPTLIEVFGRLKTHYEGKFPDRTMEILSVDRTPQDQLRLFCQGRIFVGQRVTEKDGYNALSKHNHIPSQAIDVVIRLNGDIVWADEYYQPIGDMIFQLGYSGEIRWGGVFRDYGHLETR